MKRLNLLPRQALLGRRGGPVGQVRWLVKHSPRFRNSAIAVGVVVGIALGQHLMLWRYRAVWGVQKRELSQIQTASVRFREQQQALEMQRAELMSQRQRLEARRQALEGLRQPSVAVSTLLADLVEVLPEDSWLTKLQLTEDGLKLTGAASDTRTVAELVASMDRSKRFRNTTFSHTQRSSDSESAGAFNFEVSTIPVWHDQGST